MMSLNENGLGQFQSFVDQFFEYNSRYWKDIYQEDSLNAFIYRERKSVVLAMVEDLDLPSRSLVLDVGCGAGSTTVALAERGYIVDAVDTVGAMLDLTRQAAADVGVESRVKTGVNNVLEMSFPSERFDLVVAMGVLPWLEQPERALTEMDRVLKEGGHMILTADNNWCLSQMLDPLCFPGLRPLRWKIADLLECLNLRTVEQPRSHRHSIEYVERLLSQKGLKKVQGKTLGFGPFTFFKQRLLPDRIGIKLHKRLQSVADTKLPGIRSAGTEYVVMARKAQRDQIAWPPKEWD